MFAQQLPPRAFDPSDQVFRATKPTYGVPATVCGRYPVLELCVVSVANAVHAIGVKQGHNRRQPDGLTHW